MNGTLPATLLPAPTGSSQVVSIQYIRYSKCMAKNAGPGRPSNRARVLEAATAVALREGPGAVTIEAVVSEAGMSRGGVLYHFPSKDALLQALVDQDIDSARDVTGLDSGTAGDGSSADRIRAYYDACTAMAPERGRIALAVALAENPGLLRSWIAVQRELDTVDAADQGGHATASLVARLALDGLWFSDLIDPDRFTAAERKRLVSAILASASEPAGGAS
jgi:AcrR family transcriptional regulator